MGKSPQTMMKTDQNWSGNTLTPTLFLNMGKIYKYMYELQV